MEQSTSNSREVGLLTALILSLTRVVIRWPGVTLSLCVVMALISLGITARFLTFKTDRADLINSKADFHQRWLRFQELFGDDSDIVVVIEGPDEHAIKPVMDWIGTRLESESDLFTRVLYKIDPSALQSRALQYLSPAELEKANQRLEMYAPILAGHWSRAGLESYCRRLASYIQHSAEQGAEAELAGALAQSQALINSLARFLQDPQNFVSPWPEVISQSAFPSSSRLEPQYQLTPSGKMGFVLALPRMRADNFNGKSESLKELKNILAEARSEFPGVQIGATGIPILEAEEMARSQYDMSLASVISTIGVTLVMLFGFRGLRHPILSMLMLWIGFSWTLGYVTLVVGHLNILSVSFAAILIGLGCDYSIHYLTHYVELRRSGRSLEDSLYQTVRDVGSGSVTAAISTSLSFFCATLTNFLGVSELGIIAGGGILLCALATLTALPAMIIFADRNRSMQQIPSPFEGVLLRRVIRRYPRVVTCLSLLLVAVLGIQMFEWKDGRITSKVKYDYNLLNLQVQGLEAVDLQERIFAESNGSLLFAVSIADSPQSARLLKEKLLELPTVSRVDELASYLPTYPASETNLLVQAIHARLSGLSELPREFPHLNPLTLGQGLESLFQTLKSRPEEGAQIAAATLNNILDVLEQLSLEQQLQVFGGYQQGLLMSLHRQFQMLAAISNPTPVSASDFPEALRSRFVSKTGEWLVRAYPNAQIWDEEPLREFVTDIRSVDPEATGTPMQNYEAAGQIQDSYMVASMYALAAILLVLLLDNLRPGMMLVVLVSPLVVVGFWYALARDSVLVDQPIWFLGLYVGVALAVSAIFNFTAVRNTVVAMLPPALGLILVFGIMALIDIELNPANLIVLPLIMGIGVDEGVLVIHDYRTQKGAYEVGASTINSIMMTSVTSIMGFGSMMIASHRGLFSLSVVLTIGVATCLFVSLVMLPAILTWLSRSRLQGQNQTRDQEPVPEPEEVPHIVPMIPPSTVADAA